MDSFYQIKCHNNLINKRLSQMYYNTQPFRNFIFNLDQRIHSHLYQQSQSQSQPQLQPQLQQSQQQSQHQYQYHHHHHHHQVEKRPRSSTQKGYQFCSFLEQESIQKNGHLLFEPSTPTTIGSNTIQEKQEEEEHTDLFSPISCDENFITTQPSSTYKNLKRNHYDINDEQIDEMNKKFCLGWNRQQQDEWINKHFLEQLSSSSSTISSSCNSGLPSIEIEKGKNSFFSDVTTIETINKIHHHDNQQNQQHQQNDQLNEDSNRLEDLLLSDLIALENDTKLNTIQSSSTSLTEDNPFSFIEDLLS